jgi:energy-coupling factor transport system substrate-specific component
MMIDTSATRTPAAASAGGAGPQQLGIGMRFSLHPHCDDFVGVILGALADAREAGLDQGLVIESDEVSTYVGARNAPAEQRLVAYLAGVLGAASRRTGGGHVVAHVLLSRGCPGEVSCDLRAVGLPAPAPVEVAPTGVRAVAQWSLYPLMDGWSSAGSHMVPIEAAISAAQQRGTASASSHYATTLTGDVAEVLATATDAWAAVGAQVAHVVSHLTVSFGSPSVTDGGR